MKSFTNRLIVTLLIAGSWAADLDRRQDASATASADVTTITGSGQGNGGPTEITNGANNGQGDTTTSITSDSNATQSSSAQATSASSGAAKGMAIELATMPLLAGGVLAAAANAVLLL
ncbi:hypothetical protein BGW36DRAFT_355291 [Talaromyces proteolyticus]|uniref:GPI anchored protein n=1 Tax=Talaromyces proteolyticus TaxID=1131652 RepID=A0AAD4Q580_9EURO|nr:uncharacterized protein BGW36DRAFT_355291 [Talaromyces proteolyticus]KAH8703894.1 hypothetical protein BGW36DRAFT_355291 [Talaromyces proteolyticus]